MGFLKMSKLVLKSAFRKPATKMYPSTPQTYHKYTRGHIENDIAQCVFCGICAKKCPTGAIQVVRNDATWSIERMSCIQCNCCVEVCPKKCLLMDNHYTAPSQTKEKEVFTGARATSNRTDN